MEKINDGLYKVTTKEIKTLKPDDFGESSVYVVNEKTNDYIYIIELRKGEYKTYGLRSRVMDAKTMNYLSCIAGSRKPFTPYYIKDFIYR